MIDLVGRTGHTGLRDLRGRGGWADYLDDCEIDGWRGGDRPGCVDAAEVTLERVKHD